MPLSSNIGRLTCALALAASAAAPSVAAEATAEDLVNALNAVFGSHAKTRSGHAKGFCVKGSFAPSADAAALTKAANFAKPVDVVGRFSLGGGNPAAADNGKEPVRGLALHFNLDGGATTDMVLISAPVFVAKTPEQFLTLLQTVATKDGAKIKAYFDANPESTRQGAWLGARPVPSSYATVSYYSVHAFTLTNAKGESKVVKWKVVPTGGEVGLTDDEAKAKAPDFYTGEMKERLAKGPATFDVTAVIGQDGDPVADPTALWPEDRRSVKMGTLSISAVEDNATCDAGIFDPTAVIDGIAGPKDDRIFEMRSPAYAVSFGRRQ